MFNRNIHGHVHIENSLDVKENEIPAGLEKRHSFFIFIILLGCFSLFALYGAVSLNGAVQSVVQKAVDDGFSWESTRQKLTRLSALAGRINAPINNVFMSRDINTERREMRNEYLAFVELLEQLNKQVEARNDESSEQILNFLDDVNASLFSMMTEAEYVFTFFQAGQFDLAISRMAAADNLYRESIGFIGNADQIVQHVALDRLNSQTSDIRQYYNLGKLIIIVLICCFMVFVLLGIRMVTTLNRHQKKLYYSRNLLTKTLNSVADAVIGCQQDGRITEWNMQASHIFGHDLKNRVNIDSLIPGVLSQLKQIGLDGTAEIHINHLKAVSDFMFEHGGEDALGDIDVDINVARITKLGSSSAASTAYVLTIRDMRDFRRNAALIAKSQSKLRLQLHQNDLIRQELADQAEILEYEKHRAEVSTEAKSRFLAVMSHELRTPMNAILGFSKILRRGELKPSQQEVLKRIIDASQHLLGIINDILDMSKIESGGLTLESRSVLFVEELKHTVQSFVDIKKKKNLRFFAHIDPCLPQHVLTDTTRLRQVITNLLANAFQFTEHGCIWLKIYPISDLDVITNTQLIRFEVHDTGIGMTPEQVEKVFDPFTQADDSITRKYGGTGLGLTITQQLIQSFGGEIQLDSVIHEGSSFSFNLPIQLDIQNRDEVRISTEIPRRPLAVVSQDARFMDWIKYTFEQTQVEFQVFDDLSEAFISWWLQASENQSELQPLILVDGYLSDYDSKDFIKVFDKQNMLLSSCLYLVSVGSESHLQAEQVYGKSLYMPIFPVVLLQLLAKNTTFTAGSIDSIDSPACEVPHLTGKQILVVDDVLSNRQYVHELLKPTGCEVTLVESAQAAIDMCQIRLFDIIFMDIHMPLMNGYEATKTIKQIRYAKKTHIVGLTADAMDSALVQCLEAGMTSCISKPINADDFYSTILFLINKKKPERRHVTSHGLEHLQVENVNIDIQGALDRINNKGDLYLKLIHVFLRRIENLDTRLRGFLSQDINTETSQFLESIRGTALSVGAVELSETLSQFELALKQDSEAHLVLDLCSDVLTRTRQAMNTIEKKLPQVGYIGAGAE